MDLSRKAESNENLLSLISIAFKIKGIYNLPSDELDAFLWDLAKKSIHSIKDSSSAPDQYPLA